MLLINLFAEIQANPQNIAAYRKVIAELRILKRHEEAEAFIQLMRKKFNVDYSNPDEKQ